MEPNLNQENELDCLVTGNKKQEESIVLKKTKFQSKADHLWFLPSALNVHHGAVRGFPVHTLEKGHSKLLILPTLSSHFGYQIAKGRHNLFFFNGSFPYYAFHLK